MVSLCSTVLLSFVWRPYDALGVHMVHAFHLSVIICSSESKRVCTNRAKKTIVAVYPHYYPKGAVEFFSKHHCIENVREDFQRSQIYLYCEDNKPVGTVTVYENEISRLFVLPEYQGKGYGKALPDFAEDMIWEMEKYDAIHMDALLPAKRIYLKRGYRETEYHIIEAGEDFLCYDVMELNLTDRYCV